MIYMTSNHISLLSYRIIIISQVGQCLMKNIPNFRPVKLMSDAAPAIFDGLSEVYPTMKKGKCYFHVMKNIRDRQYTDSIEKNNFLSDLRAYSFIIKIPQSGSF